MYLATPEMCPPDVFPVHFCTGATLAALRKLKVQQPDEETMDMFYRGGQLLPPLHISREEVQGMRPLCISVGTLVKCLDCNY